MNTYLIKWIPKMFAWDELPDAIKAIRQRGFVDDTWTCGVTKKIKRGDRVFLMRNATPPTGIVGSGLVLKEPYLRPHFAQPHKLVLGIDVRFDTLLNPASETILSGDELKTPELVDGPWWVQGSGQTIPPKTAADLELRWAAFLAEHGRASEWLPEEVPSPALYFEGATRKVAVNVYERSAEARRDCIKHHGCKCVVCGFCFEQRYGDWGKDFIHVHHLKQLAEIGAEYQIDPVKDLQPVCPNCHAMLHRGARMLSIEELRRKIIR